MRSVERRHHQASHFRIEQIVAGRFLRAMDELVPIDDLHNPVFVGAVAEINPIALRTERNHPVQLFWNRAARAGLLAGQTEIADFDRVGGIAHVIDFGHPVDAPARHT